MPPFEDLEVNSATDDLEASPPAAVGSQFAKRRHQLLSYLGSDGMYWCTWFMFILWVHVTPPNFLFLFYFFFFVCFNPQIKSKLSK